ncbi:MAG: ATP-binding cassette domain-containing protein [Nitrospirae bacterium]|nr:ATP-binding cassette domain-containing protein [Nitrospirota bacterium]
MKNTMDGFKVTCEKVSYSPPGQPELKILKEVDFTVNQGEFLTIIGGNGTGKSTLLKAIAGELMITAGKILISGRHINTNRNKLVLMA